MMKASLFDLDGTVIDSVPRILYSLKRTLDAFDLRASDEYLLSTIGTPLTVVGESYLSKGRGEEFYRQYQRFYDEAAARFPITAFPGMKPLMEKLHGQGQKLAVVTSKRQAPTLEAVEAVGIGSLLAQVVSFPDTEEHKPLPAPALLACEKLGVKPCEAFMVGDSLHDVLCGKAAGCVTVAVTWGALSEAELLTAEPDIVCHTMAELEQALTERS